MHTGFVGCGYIVWFGQYTEIAFLVSLFGYTQPIRWLAHKPQSHCNFTNQHAALAVWDENNFISTQTNKHLVWVLLYQYKQISSFISIQYGGAVVVAVVAACCGESNPDNRKYLRLGTNKRCRESHRMCMWCLNFVLKVFPKRLAPMQTTFA